MSKTERMLLVVLLPCAYLDGLVKRVPEGALAELLELFSVDEDARQEVMQAR